MDHNFNFETDLETEWPKVFRRCTKNLERIDGKFFFFFKSRLGVGDKVNDFGLTARPASCVRVDEACQGCT